MGHVRCAALVIVALAILLCSCGCTLSAGEAGRKIGGSDKNAGEPDGGADDDADDGGDACDVDCYSTYLVGSADCYHGYYECLEAGDGEPSCGDGLDDCMSSAFEDLVNCADACDACLEGLFDCFDSCPRDDAECFLACYGAFMDCADWLDRDCIVDCESDFAGCQSDCEESQDYSSCHACVDCWLSCMEVCL